MAKDEAEGARPEALAALYRAMSPRRRRHLWGLVAAMFGAGLAEIATIAAVVPFVAALTGAAPPGLPAPSIAGGDMLWTASAMLIGAAAAAAALRLLLLWLAQSFATGLGHEVGTQIFARLLRQPYSAYLERHSSEVLSGVEKLQALVANVFLPLVHAAAGATVALAIFAILLAVSPLGTALGAAFLVAGYAIASLVARGRLSRNSVELARLSKARIRAVQDALGAIRDILIEGSQPIFESRFRDLDGRFRRAQAVSLFAAGAPRFIVEGIGLIAVALVAVAMSRLYGGVAAALPVLATLALGAQRLLPLAQQVWFGWSQLAGNRQAILDIVALLEMPVTEPLPAGDVPPLTFASHVDLVGVSYSHAGAGTPALRDATLRIPRRTRIGIVGPTGSGKSTLLDLLMGLIEPDEGQVRIDGRPLDARLRRAWQAKIAHVPQAVFLTDDSIASNIAFGIEAAEIDHARVREVARRAQLDRFVAALPDGLATRVGEAGTRLSGGERQRIGVARALYKRAELLILDEATSALDERTEAALLESLDDLEGVTIVIVAHRPSALAICDEIVRLENGRIHRPVESLAVC